MRAFMLLLTKVLRTELLFLIEARMSIRVMKLMVT